MNRNFITLKVCLTVLCCFSNEFLLDDPSRIDGFLLTLEALWPLEEFPLSTFVVPPPPANVKMIIILILNYFTVPLQLISSKVT